MADLIGVPGTPQIWIVDNYKVYLVYTVPDTSPPVYLSWHIPNEADFQAILGPDVPVRYDRQVTAAQVASMGVLNFGTTNDLANFDDDPFSSWASNIATQAATQPWILDGDYQALIAMATLEGRQLTEAEIQSTDWWQNNTQAQREWMKLYHGDPLTASQRIEDNRLATIDALKQAGVENPSDALVNHVADQLTMGKWSTVEYQTQIRGIADPYAGIDLDPTVQGLMAPGQGTVLEGAERVRETVRTWLGPVHGAWSDEQIEAEAGRFRNDPDYLEELTARLRAQRMSLFPGYTDPSLTYEDLASPWRPFVTQIWGQQADETSPMFGDLIRNNDATVNAQLLRQEGLNQGIGKVKQDLERATLQGMGGSVRPVI